MVEVAARQRRCTHASRRHIACACAYSSAAVRAFAHMDQAFHDDVTRRHIGEFVAGVAATAAVTAHRANALRHGRCDE